MVVAIAMGLVRGAHAGELGSPRPPVRLEISSCLEHERDAIQRAVRVELGDEPAAFDDASAAVRVECAPDGLDAGVVLEVRHAGSPHRYRYALDWRAQPLDARPRLIGLAVAEAVDASRIELTAVPEPAERAIAAPARPRGWSVGLVVDRRAFSARRGVDLVGVGLTPTRRLSPHVYLAADVLVEGASVLSVSGAVAVRTVSSAPRIVYRAGGRLHGELGLGVRVGVVRMEAEARPGSMLVGSRLVRAWLGPVATVALGIDMTPAIAVTAGFEIGRAVTGATARDLGEPVAVVGDAWTSFGLAAAIVL